MKIIRTDFNKKVITDISQHQEATMRTWSFDLDAMSDELILRLKEAQVIHNEAHRYNRVKHLKAVGATLAKLYDDRFTSYHSNNTGRLFNSVCLMERSMRKHITSEHPLYSIDCANSHPFLFMSKLKSKGINIDTNAEIAISNGLLYDSLMTGRLSREEVKIMTFRLFFRKTPIPVNDISYLTLYNSYPILAEYIRYYAQRSSFAMTMQKLEVKVWIEGISNTLMLLGIPHVTAHDSIIFSSIDEILVKHLQAVVYLQFRPTIPTLHITRLDGTPISKEFNLIYDDEVGIKEVIDDVKDVIK